MRCLMVVLCAGCVLAGPLFDWQTTTELPRGSWRHACAATANHLYFLAGGEGPQADCYFSRFNPDGTIGQWVATSNLPVPLGWFSAEATASHLYVIGGWNNSGLTSAVRYAAIDSTGALGAWQTTTSLPVPLYTHGGILVDSCIYTVGGATGIGQPVVADVRFARIQPDGNLGAWQTTSPLPGVNRLNGIVHYNGFIYSLGGRPDAAPTAAVWYAARNPDGTLGSWQTATSLPAAVEGATCVALAGRLYVVGGLTANCWSAPVNPDGSVGQWTAEPALPQPRWAADGLEHAGRIYVPGGYLSSGQSTVYYSSPLVDVVEQPARVTRRRALSVGAAAEGELYDALGRRVSAGRVRSGVYFMPSTGGGSKAILVR